MLKFFQRIRRKLLDEGQLWKYLVYAVGEILLVVIGILIALQINNWNENQKNKKAITVYLKSYIEDLENDKKNLSALKELNNFRYHSLQHLLKLAGESPNNPDRIGYIAPPRSDAIWKGEFPMARALFEQYSLFYQTVIKANTCNRSLFGKHG